MALNNSEASATATVPTYSQGGVKYQQLTKTAEPTKLIVGDLKMDLLTREVQRAGEKIELQPREFALLEYLMRSTGRTVTKTMILEHIFDYSFDPQTNVIDVHIARLRPAVDKGFERPLLHTVRGAGYVLRDGG